MCFAYVVIIQQYDVGHAIIRQCLQMRCKNTIATVAGGSEVQLQLKLHRTLL
jgi:hypothetical protein